MKKFNWLIAIVVALSIMGCKGESKYAALGNELATQLNNAVEKQDVAAAIAADMAIRENEKQIKELGDSAAIAEFREAVNESRQRNAAYLAAIKVESGRDADSVINEVVHDAMDRNVNINAVTESIDSVLLSKQKKQKK